MKKSLPTLCLLLLFGMPSSFCHKTLFELQKTNLSLEISRTAAPIDLFTLFFFTRHTNPLRIQRLVVVLSNSISLMHSPLHFPQWAVENEGNFSSFSYYDASRFSS